MAVQSILIFISALTCLIAFPPLNLYWLQLVSLIPFLYVLHRCYIYFFTTHYVTQLKWFTFIGFVFGLFYMGLSNVLVFELVEFSSWVAMVVLFFVYTVYEALFFALMTLCLRLCNGKFMLFPFIWIIFEWLKSIGPYGSPNGILGYSQANNDLINHLASAGGIFFVSFVCVLINVCIFLFLIKSAQEYRHRNLMYLVVIASILLSSFYYAPPLLSSSKSISVASIQANHVMPFKFKRKNRPLIRQDYLRLSQLAFDRYKPDLIIWPETITASLNLEFKSLMTPIQRMTATNTAFIFGSPRKENNHYYNSAAFVTSKTITTYDKIQLMPFGEYWPLKRVFQFLRLSNIIPGSEYSHGTSPTLFEFNTIKLAPIICLESTNSSLSRYYANQGADILISLVNNAWFKDSSIAARQLQMLQFRSIEVGLPSIQSANMGFTCFINATGKITGLLDKYQQDYVYQSIDCIAINTPFRTWGNAIVLVSFIIILLTLLRRYYLYKHVLDNH